MRGATCFSGIGAPEIAMPHIDWIWHSEIEPFPCAVMAARHPNNRNLGDILAPDFIDRAKALGPLDIMVGGPPCQAFSIAGLRQSLADPRGNLSLRWVQVLHAIRPSIAVTENVPGWLSTADNAFGCFLAGIVGADAPLNSPLERGRWPNHGMVSGPLARAAWRVLDAQYVRTRSFPWAVPQRRRRVFVVISFGTSGLDPAAVLFDRESLRGNPAPRREAGESTSTDVAPSLVSSGRGVERAGETRGQDPVVAVHDWPAEVAPTLNAHFGEKQGLEDQHIRGGAAYSSPAVANPLTARMHKGINTTADEGQTPIIQHGGGFDDVAHSLRAEGFDASEDGTGRGTPIVPVQQPFSIMPMNSGKDYKARPTDVAQPIMAGGPVGGNQGGDFVVNPQPVNSAFTFNTTQLTSPQNGQDLGPDKPCHSLAAKDHPPAVAFDMRGREGGAMPEGPHDTANIRAASGGSSRSYAASAAWGVRRLTPRECERLMGFPDDFTLIPWRGKAAENCPDGVRYKALGNSIAVNVISFIGERIEAVRAVEVSDQNPINF